MTIKIVDEPKQQNLISARNEVIESRFGQSCNTLDAGAGDCELNNLQLTTAIEAEGFRECDQDMDLALSWAEMSACIVSWISNYENFSFRSSHIFIFWFLVFWSV